MSTEESYLECPECDEDAIPASGVDANGRPTWGENDDAICPGCGLRLVARITGDGEDEWAEAEVMDEC